MIRSILEEQQFSPRKTVFNFMSWNVAGLSIEVREVVFGAVDTVCPKWDCVAFQEFSCTPTLKRHDHH